MTEDERYYIQLEIMQEFDYLEKGTNIMELLAQREQEEEVEKPVVELENHMVVNINEEEY